MVGLFVSGNDTEIGKTIITAAIATIISADNKALCIRKPVASGCGCDDNAKSCEDTTMLKLASKSFDSPEKITPFSYKRAVAPPIAAKENNRKLTISMLVQACQPQPKEFLLVEGVGGLGSPIAEDGINADVVKQLKLPIVLVIGSKLGCVGHTIMLYHYIQSQRLTLHSIILNDISNDESSLKTNQQLIEQWTDTTVSLSSYFCQQKNQEVHWQTLAKQLKEQYWNY